MNKYIIELLKLESTVIIPNFGALMKSGKSLIFNSILKYNDQKLEKFIAEQENMELQDVANALAKYVREINAVIEKGDEFIIVGIGSFYKTDNDKIGLKISEEITITSPQQDNTPIEKPIKTENTVTSLYKEKEAKKENANTPTENDLIQSVSTKNVKKEEEIIAKTPVSEPITTPKEVIKKEPVKTEEIKTKTKEVKVKPPKKEKKKKKGLIWILLILLILGGAGTFIGLNLEQVKNWVGLNKTEHTEEETIVVKEDLEELNSNETDPEEELMEIDSTDVFNENNANYNEADVVIVEEELVVEKKTEVTKPTNKSLSFHVVVGAFGSESNATGLVAKMKKEGFSSASVLGKFGSLYKVAASSHATKEDATIGLEKAKSINEDAFIDKINL